MVRSGEPPTAVLSVRNGRTQVLGYGGGMLTPTICRWDRRSGRYHNIIWPFWSTMVRGSSCWPSKGYLPHSLDVLKAICTCSLIVAVEVLKNILEKSNMKSISNTDRTFTTLYREYLASVDLVEWTIADAWQIRVLFSFVCILPSMPHVHYNCLIQLF